MEKIPAKNIITIIRKIVGISAAIVSDIPKPSAEKTNIFGNTFFRPAANNPPTTAPKPVADTSDA